MTKHGAARSHEAAAAHVTGRAVYTDDQVRPTGMLTCWPVHSPHAHARITGVDAAPALAVRGVVTVLRPQDIPGPNDVSGHTHDEQLLPTDEVHYLGQAVTWVVAETDDAARLGAAAVTVDYEPLPAVTTLTAAIAADSYSGPEKWITRGDAEAVLATAPLVLDGEVLIGGQDHFYLETQASWASIDAEGNVVVHSSTQHPAETQIVVARVLGLARNRVTVTCLRMGGGFGGKETQANGCAAIAALAAYVTGRPVRVRLNREQDMVLTGKRHPFHARYRVAATQDGRLLALQVALTSDGGWSLDLSEPVTSRAMFHVDNSYYIPQLTVSGRVARTNTTSHTAFRGFGGPQGMLVAEEVLERVARHLGLRPEEVRRRNLYRDAADCPPDEVDAATTHYGQLIEGNRLPRIWRELLDSSDFTARRAGITAHNASRPHRKRGLAITPVKFGISFTNTKYNQAGALVLIYADGSIQLNHGGTEMGQGLHTKMLEVAASTLGVSPGRFRAMPTATDKVPNTSATAASSGSDLNGQAVRDSCLTLRLRLSEVAARMLGRTGSEDLVFVAERVHAPGEPGHAVAFDEVVAEAYAQMVSLSATGFYRTPNIHWNPETGRGKPFHYFAYGAAVSEVEVDGFTGCFRLRRVDILHDVGDSLNPLVDRGQVEGGFVQGMGWLTMEEVVWDATGRLQTFAPSTYKIPTVSEVPEDFRVQLLSDATQDRTVHGSKAVGEPPLMLALSVREAIRDAVAAFASTPEAARHVPLASPATPEATLWAIERLRDRAPRLQQVAVPP